MKHQIVTGRQARLVRKKNPNALFKQFPIIYKHFWTAFTVKRSLDIQFVFSRISNILKT